MVFDDDDDDGKRMGCNAATYMNNCITNCVSSESSVSITGKRIRNAGQQRMAWTWNSGGRQWHQTVSLTARRCFHGCWRHDSLIRRGLIEVRRYVAPGGYLPAFSLHAVLSISAANRRVYKQRSYASADWR